MKTIKLKDEFGDEMELIQSYSLRERLDQLENTNYTGCFITSMIDGKVNGIELYIESPMPRPTPGEIRQRRIRNFLIWIGRGLGVDLD